MLKNAFRIFAGLILITFGSGALAYFSHFLNMDNSTDTMKAQFLMDNLTGSTAYFAGGCFWCMEGIFEAQTGVTEAISGYAGGTREDANYEKVSAGVTDHREAVVIYYDPKIISYETLVRLYFTQIDPTQTDGQFADRGYRYTTAILYASDEERIIAEKVKKEIGDSGKFDKPIAVKIEPFTTFFPAEEYHQDYYKKSSFRYNLYKEGSGRKGFIEDNWQKDIEKIETTSKADLKSKLSDIQYAVTQEDATERPFQNAYWDNHRDGIYVDIVDGSPLFASIDKFDSGTGWPSFTRVMTGGAVAEKTDYKLAMSRTEVRSKNADSHLGHLFTDGPEDKGGMRYCINSAALRFVQKEDMEKEGYGEYLNIFNE